MSAATFQKHPWSRHEYERMVGAGVFDPEVRLELVDGDIVNMTPQGSLHATAAGLVADLLQSLLSTDHFVRVQMPLALDDNSEPEPDVAVVAGNRLDYRDKHPATAALVVEVADSSLEFDRLQKKSVYARNQIPEYWIINLVEQTVEVYKQPVDGDYVSKQFLKANDSITPPAFTQQPVAVSSLLP